MWQCLVASWRALFEKYCISWIGSGSVIFHGNNSFQASSWLAVSFQGLLERFDELGSVFIQAG
jgi:hypothetical protein